MAQESSNFAAIDLDAVLDDFESKQEIEEQLNDHVVNTLKINDTVFKDNYNELNEQINDILEDDLKPSIAEEPQKTEQLEQNSAQENQQELTGGFENEKTLQPVQDDQSHWCVEQEVPSKSIEVVIEQPKVLEEPTENSSTIVEDVSNENPDSHVKSKPESSSENEEEFESIYDSKTEASEEQIQEDPVEPESVEIVSGARPRIPEVNHESPPPYSEIDPKDNDEPIVEPIQNQDEQVNADETVACEEESNNESNETGSVVNATIVDDPLNGLTEDQMMLGKVTPHWVPDTEAQSCMICDSKFTLVKRRHHCRACGRVLCNTCCSDKEVLLCLNNKVARVCKPCKLILQRLKPHQDADSPGSPNESAHSTPVSVLKKTVVGATGGTETTAEVGKSNENKQVMFSDGIVPGGELTELDQNNEPSRSAYTSSRRRRNRRSHRSTAEIGRTLIPTDVNLMPRLVGDQESRNLDEIANLMTSMNHLVFRVNKNLKVHVKSIEYTPISQELWSYRSEGLSSVGQDEVVILLQKIPDEFHLQRDILEHFQTLYEQARGGHPVIDMSHTAFLSGTSFLGSTEYGGFLYFRHSFQSLEGLDLPPSPPFLFAVLLSTYEITWAKVFPLRLKLRLGAELRYYPAPIWSVRNRKSVYKSVGNTILKLLCDFNTFTYSLPIVRGLLIHMELKLTTIIVPKDRHPQIEKALLHSNEPVLAIGASFSSFADSHLVAVQDEDSDGNFIGTSDYKTQAINIMNQSRKVTGASFVIFNGALKTSTGLSAKSSIVEDGIMVQITQDKMLEVRKNLSEMKDIEIKCGPVDAETPDEVVILKWADKNHSLSQGVHSLVDNMSLCGISSIRLHSVRDFISPDCNYFIRWTEVFNLSDDKKPQISSSDPIMISTSLAKAICSGLGKHLRVLREDDKVTKLAVRVKFDPENAGYEAGGNGPNGLNTKIINCLDSVLVPLVHGENTSIKHHLELIFHILDLS